MKVQFQLEVQDYLNAKKLHSRNDNLISLFLISSWILASLVSFAIAIFHGTREFIYYGLTTLAAAGVSFLYRSVLLPRRTNKIIEQIKEMHMPFELEITTDALVISTEHEHSEQPWSIFRKWKEDENVLLLYHSKALFSILPKRILSTEQIEAIKTYLQANQVSTKAPRRSGRSGLMMAILFVVILAFVVWNLLQTIGY